MYISWLERSVVIRLSACFNSSCIIKACRKVAGKKPKEEDYSHDPDWTADDNDEEDEVDEDDDENDGKTVNAEDEINTVINNQ